MINTFTLEPKTITNLMMHHGTTVNFFIVEGSCSFETIYNNETVIVEKNKHEKYIIQEKVEYRLRNTCETPCVLIIITNLEEELEKE